MTTLTAIAPERAAELVRAGAAIIDIREADEHAREKIPGARHFPLSCIGSGPGTVREGDKLVIFHCRSGLRTQSNAPALAAAAQSCDAYMLEGGLNAWKKAGLPIIRDRRQPIEIIRQVQIVAGGLVLLAVLLGTFVTPGFYAAAGFVGAGLLFAGISGFCGMAKLLSLMPWNRRTAAAKPR